MMYSRTYQKNSYSHRQYCILDHWIIKDILDREKQKEDRQPAEIADIVQTPELDYDPDDHRSNSDYEVPRGVVVIIGNDRPDTSDTPGVVIGNVIQM